jgi:hypothetical protein
MGKATRGFAPTPPRLTRSRLGGRIWAHGRGAVSSAGERLLHTQEVAGSNPAPPTIVIYWDSAEVAEWQTRYVQGVVSARTCGFKSHLRHQRRKKDAGILLALGLIE